MSNPAADAAARVILDYELKKLGSSIVALENLRADWAEHVPIHETAAARELGRVDPDEYRRLFRRNP